MKQGISFLPVLLVMVLVLISGCSNVSMGNVKASNVLGDIPPEQQALYECFGEDYEGLAEGSRPMFVDEGRIILTTGIINETPVDRIVSFNKDTRYIYYWSFYMGFQPGDTIVMEMKYYPEIPGYPYSGTGIPVLTTNRTVDGKYGAVYGSVEKPDTGWALGRYSISFDMYREGDPHSHARASGGASATNEATRLGLLPCQEPSAADRTEGMAADRAFAGVPTTTTVTPEQSYISPSGMLAVRTTLAATTRTTAATPTTTATTVNIGSGGASSMKSIPTTLKTATATPTPKKTQNLNTSITQGKGIK